MKVTRFNISKPKKYTKGNEEKTMWNNIGTMTVFQKDDGTVNRIIEIPAIGLDAHVFPFEPKTPEQPTQSGTATDFPTQPAVNAVNPEDIPF